MMNPLKSFFMYSAAAVLSALSLGGTASAQTIYVKLINNSGYDVTISNLNWHGSYDPRIEGTVAAGSTAYGTLRIVNHEAGYKADIQFDASFTTQPDGNTKTCTFYQTHDIGTGELTNLVASSVAGTPYPGCKADHSGSSSITYTISAR